MLAIVATILSASCNQLPATGDAAHQPPDLLDRIRAIDLLPRAPTDAQSTNKAMTNRARPAVYSGSEIDALAPPPPGATPTGNGYELNFENTPVATVAKVVLGDIMGVGYSIDPRVQGTVTLSSGRPVPKSDIVYVLENALRLSGVVLVKDTAGYRLVPVTDAVGAGSLDQTAARAQAGYGVSVVPLQYVSAATLAKLLDSFVTKAGTVRADTARNLLLIQGNGPERREAIDTVLSFDVDWMRGQSVGIYPVQNSNPEPLITELEKIMDSAEGGLNQNIIKFQPVARMNAILVVARKPDLLATAGKWIGRLDSGATTRTGVHVYRLKYGDARQMARVLNELFVGTTPSSLDQPSNQIAPGSGLSATSSGGGAGGGGGLGGGGGGFGAAGQGASGGLGSRQQGGGSDARSGFSATQSGLGAQGNAAGALDTRNGALGGQAILPGVRITADISSNALLIYASPENYQIILQAMRELDRPQLQVAIDATVAEITLNDNLSYGVQTFLQNSRGSISNIPTSPPGQSSVNAAGLVGAALNRAFPGFNFLYGSELNPNLILDALHAVTDVRVLSNPSLVVVDNQVASLIVGADVPISTGSASVLNSATATSNTIVNTIDYRSTGIILRVIPHININGNVRLDIEQEISQVVNATTSTTVSTTTPTISERKVKSSIAIANGQTVLLAGLIQDSRETDRGGIPLLDQIPLFGDAVSHKNTAIARTELIIFIRPQIIRDGLDAHYVAEELRTKLQGTISALAPSPNKSR